MRGGLDTNTLMYNTDIGDIEVINKVVEENIETTKKSGMPLI
jgi:hypothetical protein|tara:strand:- start:1446 stop:1571 length:126 start_codon:yes stop_codon:yes gene_type:complete